MPTLSLTLIEPVEDAALSGVTKVRYSYSDNGGAVTAHAVVDQNGASLGTPVRISGTTQAGVMEVVWDTRDWPSDPLAVTARATGSDAAIVSDSAAVTLSNSISAQTSYMDIELDQAPDAGNEFEHAHLALERPAISANPRRQSWMFIGVRTEAMETDLEDAEESAEHWDEHQPVAPHVDVLEPALGLRPERAQIRAYDYLKPPGQEITFRLKFVPVESYDGHETGLERIVKIRRISDGLYFVFARNMDGSEAKFYSFDGDALTLLETGSDYENGTDTAAAAADAALIGTDLYLVIPFGLLHIDRAPSSIPKDKTRGILAWGETRTLQFVEGVGTTLMAVYVDAGAMSNKTQVYSMDATGLHPKYTISEAVTMTYVHGGNLWMAAGPKLYKSVGGTSAPTLDNTFSDDITALGINTVALADGRRYVYSGSWTTVDSAGATAGAAINQANLGLTTLDAVETLPYAAYEESLDLFVKPGATWVLDSEIEALAGMAGTDDRITVLEPYEKEIEPPVDTEGSVEPGVYRRGLIIGTGDSGHLYLLERAAIDESMGAVKVSALGSTACVIPTQRAISTEDE
jgi:hypothetical protein